jgi:TrmH family RNA methyltransferase
VEHISSRSNALVKRLRALANDGGAEDEVLLDGAHLIAEALTARVEVRVVVVASDAVTGPLGALAAHAAAHGARAFTLTPALAAAVSPVRKPTGILAIAAIRAAPLAEVLSRAPQLVLLLDHVQDPGNVGAIIRAAEACGATGIVAGPGTANPFSWKALRGGMGSTFRMPVARVDSMEQTVREARSRGFRIFATEPRGGTPIAQADLTRPCAVLVGGEGAGVDIHLADLADERLTIPMRGQIESLNVSIAVALVLYEASRQRHDVAV